MDGFHRRTRDAWSSHRTPTRGEGNGDDARKGALAAFAADGNGETPAAENGSPQ